MSTKAERERVLETLAMSPQSKASLGDTELSGALDDLVADDKVEEYEDGVESNGQPVLMYRLAGSDD